MKSRFLQLVTAAAVIAPLSYASFLMLTAPATAESARSTQPASHASPSPVHRTVLADDWQAPTQ